VIRAALLGLLLLAGAPAWSHALQPGFLDLQALGGDSWGVYWKVPSVGAGRLPLEAVLPEACDVRRVDGLEFDGTAYTTRWVTTCPGGLQGGRILIEGLERTQTDVLVRYELAASEGRSQRLTPASPDFTIPAPEGSLGILATYVTLGIDHILRGVDHLMFVFALMLLIPGWRQLVEAVTAFTVAHSLSLGAAALGWIAVPAAPVEAVVALSIMFLAAELCRPARDLPDLASRAPWVVAFAFGLLHGLGFARALLEIGLPEGEVPLALFAFNLGVEIGQLLFIALVLVLAALLARLYPQTVASVARPGRRGSRVAGYAMGSTAAVWFAGRLAAF
jgi:hypothetical protein